MQLLAQREHSRSELRRKLLACALTVRAEDTATLPYEHAAALPVSALPELHEKSTLSPAEQVEAVLDWLQANRYLSEERFVESRVHARAARFGNLRIRQELAQHGVPLDPELAQRLKSTEVDRARDVWQRKFGQVALNMGERAKQMRFLAGRGFSSEVVRQVVQGESDD